MALGTRTRYRWFFTRLAIWTDAHLNFYRVHLMAFTFIPVFSAAIFYASNGRTKISYLDSLFMCTSAMTTSGLNTVNLSTTTVWQQVILAFLMFIGNSTSVSFLVLTVRRSYFKSKCEDAVKQSRQQRHERDLIRHAMSRGGGTPGMFGRIRTRAQTILGWQPTPIIEPRPEARKEGPPIIPPEKQLRGRARGETITTSYHGTVGSDDTHIEGGENVRSGSGFGKTVADESSSANANGGHQPQPDSNTNASGFLPPTFTKTAPTPSHTLGLLPDGETTESPTDDLAQPPFTGIDAALADHSGDVEGQSNSDARSKPRPKSLALGHESDRNVLRPRNRAGAVRIGYHGMVETESPEVEFGDHLGHKIGEDGIIIDSPMKSSPLSEDRIVSTSPQDWRPKDGGIESVGVGAGTDETRSKNDPSPTSPKSPSSAAQVLTSNLSPRSETFATSPKAMSEFAPSETGAELPSVQEQGQPTMHRSPAPAYDSLSPNEHTMPLRKSTMSSTASRTPVIRPAFLHAPQIVPHGRRTTFAEQVHPLHPHGPAGANGRAAALRARNGTITSPNIPHAHMPGHTDIGPSPLGHGTKARAHGKHASGEGYGHHLHSHHPRPQRAHTGMGGLPGPMDLMHWGIERLPGVKQFIGEHEREVVNETEGRSARTGTAYMRTDSVRSNGTAPVAPDVDDISLEEEDLEKMGGDEYNALVVLSWIVGGHYFLNHVIAFMILAPYSAKVPLVRDVIEAQNESSGRKLDTTWFALFTVISAYANAGLTVVDTSLIQMSSAYLVIFLIIWLILVGATAFPLSLRFFVWIGTKIFRNGSTAKGLRFLLRHPRRCFMYLFPAHQSWYLLFTLVVIFILDWVAYLTFNIDMPGIESVPTGPRVVGGFLQAVGQRAGGFTTINLQAIAPALQVVYIATMFVQVYPIAMAVRTSNVYEESGVVIYEPEKDDEEPTNFNDGRGAGFTAYLGWHVKHQLAQDLFWLIAALTALCAFERKRILSEETAYFNIFSLFFEIVSAFANVGFSLGVSSQPFSLSGEMRTIPKLVIIGLMIRGRHRGLPMAIDRAVQLPTEYKTASHITSSSGVSSRRSTGVPISRRATVGTWSRTSVRQRQRAQDPTLDSDDEE